MLHLYDCVLGKLYDGQSHVDERHRHRYEVCVCVCSLRSPLQHILSHQVNPTYVHDIETKGMVFVGHDEEGQRMEILELKGNLLVTIAMRLSLTVHNLSQKCFEWHCYIHVTCVSSPPSHCIDHPYFVGIQYHPEYLTRPMKPSPPYLGLILAASRKLKAYIARGCVHSPRSSYDYDLECDLDDEVTQAFRLQLPNDSSLSPAPSPVNLSEQSN